MPPELPTSNIPPSPPSHHPLTRTESTISNYNLTREPLMSSNDLTLEGPFEPQDHSTPRAGSPAPSDGTEILPIAGGSRVSQGKRASGVFDVPLAGRRSMVDADPDYAAQRQAILNSARASYRANEEPLLFHLGPEDEVSLYDELTALAKALQGQPGEPTEASEEAYRPSSASYVRLRDLLRPRLASINMHLLIHDRPKMELPYWGIDGDVSLSWGPEQYTELAVLFRDEVESFLAFCLHPDTPPSATPPARSSRRQRARQTREAGERTRVVSPTSTASPVIDLAKTTINYEGDIVAEDPVPNNSFATTANATPLAKRKSRVTIELDDEPLDARSDLRNIQEELAQERTPRAYQDRSYDELPHERHGSSRRLSEIFEDPPHLSSPPPPRSPHSQTQGFDPSYPKYTPNYNYHSYSTPQQGRGGFGGGFSYGSSPNRGNVTQTPPRLGVPHFDLKLKVELIEEWDGDVDTIIDWFESVNALASRSDVVFTQLGELVPTRLKRKAKSWWLSLPQSRRATAMQNWSTLRKCIAKYYMGRQWFDRLKLKARTCRFRDSDAPGESPSEYFIRKFKLLDTAESYSESLMIMSIMDGAPKYWRSIIDTMMLKDTADLQDKIHYHEDALRQSPSDSSANIRSLENRLRALEVGRKIPTHRYPLRTTNVHNAASGSIPLPNFTWEASTHLVGYSKDLPKPAFPRDDSVRSKGKSPEDKGARPCRYCGSPKHWDNDCKHARKGMKQVRTNLVVTDDDYWGALDEYEELYCTSSQDEGEDSQDESVPLN